MAEQSTYSSSDFSKDKNQQSMKDDVVEKGKEYGKKAKEGAESLMDKAAEGAESIGEHIKDYTHTTADYIKNNPVATIIAAAAGGLIIGLLLKD